MKRDFSNYWYTDIREIDSLKDMLDTSVELFRDNPAYWIKHKRGGEYLPITYDLLKHDVDALGTRILSMGLLEKPVAIMGVNSYEWIATYIAVVNGGGVVVPIDKELTTPEIENLLKAGGCETIFCTTGEVKKLKGIDVIKTLGVMEFYGDRISKTEAPVTGISDISKYGDAVPGAKTYIWRDLLAEGEKMVASGDRSHIDMKIDPDKMIAILFTSGTTGVPKGVMLSHRNIARNIMDICRICEVLETDKTLSLLPIHHTYECNLGCLLVLYRGASTAFCEGMKYISQNMKEAQNTFIIVVPRVLEMIYGKMRKEIRKQGKEKVFNLAMKVNHRLRGVGLDMSRRLFKQILDQLGGKLRVVITGAAAIQPEVFRAFEDFGVTVLQGYGMTECAPLISGTPMSAPKERYRKAGSVGATVEQGEVKIVDPDESGIGEVMFRGPNVMLGYYNMPEETAATIEEDGFMHTGDLGFMDHEGWIYLTGRKKNVIVTRTGENVYPEEIEEIINANPVVEECMVFPYKVDGEETVAVQILPDMEHVREKLGMGDDAGIAEDPPFETIQEMMQELIKDINQGLAVYKRIRSVFVRREDFVRTTTRKIKRQENMIP